MATDPHVVRRQRCVNVAAYASARSAAPSYIVMTSLYDFRGLLPLNVLQRDADRRRARAAASAPLRRERRRDRARPADQHRPDLRRLDARHHQRPAHLLHARRRDAVLLRHPELEAVPRLLRLRGGAAAVRAQLRAGRRLAAADRRPPARPGLEPDHAEHHHDQCGDDLLRAHAGAAAPRSSWSSSTSAPRR